MPAKLLSRIKRYLTPQPVSALILSLCIGSNVLASTNQESTEDSSWEQVASRWIADEFQPSTLSPEEQLQELKWFSDAAKPFKGMTIRVVSERIDTHLYEAKTLVKAFYDLTGIRVIHEITGEDDVIKKLHGQVNSGVNLYDAYINDSDLIGYHLRHGYVRKLDQFMAGEGKSVTLPTLDLDDFIGLSFTTGPDGHLYQLPDQQFANLYWYRADWFERPELKAQFKQRYGYDLGVPQNWSAYEDIAEFFTVHVQEIDGQRVWGHMDYGKADPSLGWRISDAWLSLGGTGDAGLPNGLPVDEWGIRVEGCHPVGASVVRGGALDSPAATYAVRKYAEWLLKYAPPEARDLNFTDAGNQLAQGGVAQQIWWYSAFTAALSKPGLDIVDANGKPKWRMAPSPKGAYWKEGMKLGYQDAGSWTFLKNTPVKRTKAAWLYAQFVVSKTVSLKKTIVGLTPVRLSDIESDAMTERADSLGGLVEFYRSQGRNIWTPTGTNVPDYIQLSNYWWQHVGRVIHDGVSVEAAMSDLAAAFDSKLGLLSKRARMNCAPQLAKPQTREYWLAQPGAPKPRLANEKPPGMTLPYEESVRVWRK